jgi:tetratricopeptide (TPR) repeat protein
MDCDRTYTYDVERAFVDVEAFRSDERRNAGEWDGVVLGRIVACKNCGAEDRYSLSSQAQLAIAAQLSLGHLHDEDRESQRVTAASLRLWDGTILRRPTQGIARLRAACERQPDTGEPWRRLGNLYERFGLMDEAEDAWRRAVDDEAEVEAAYSLATRFRDCGRGEDAVEFALLAIERLPGAKALPQRAAIATILCDLLRAAANRMEPPLALMATWLGGTTGDRATVHLSCAQLRDIHHWDRLAELIGAGFFSGLRFTDDLPEDPDPQLLRLLEVQTAYVRSHPKVGRNSPCPCGSGRKYKKCCLR